MSSQIVEREISGYVLQLQDAGRFIEAYLVTRKFDKATSLQSLIEIRDALADELDE